MENLDKEQAAMYRWVRARMTRVMLNHLTGQTNDGPMSDLEVDRLLRTAFELYEQGRAADRLVDRAQIRAGILPEALGKALLDYTGTAKHLGSLTGDDDIRQADTELAGKLNVLCQEMANLR